MTDTGDQTVRLAGTGICDGRVVIVTGAGRGIGRSHALAFARQGARVVVNDLGVQLDGSDARGASGAADDVVAEIQAMGGQAVANGDDVADWDGAERMVRTAIEEFGSVDTVVNNAGFVRDRMFANATEDEWDAVVRVHLKGHFCVSRHAAAPGGPRRRPSARPPGESSTRRRVPASSVRSGRRRTPRRRPASSA
ncbi:MAG: SDR family NAD(P)-dependent oxidoreductase [Acidimicrobiales bacterium]|nr:SDR family NAD(P)-dependent oxidoreductase [Acidimicrobiales bacterium]